MPNSEISRLHSKRRCFSQEELKIYKKRQKIDLLYYDNITMGAAQEWTGSGIYDTVGYIYDLPLDVIIKSISIIIEFESPPDINIAYQVTVYQGDNVDVDEDQVLYDLIETGDDAVVRISWLPDNVIVFGNPNMDLLAENWIAETQDTNIYMGADNHWNVRLHMEDANGGDTAPTTGTIDFYLIMECEVL